MSASAMDPRSRSSRRTSTSRSSRMESRTSRASLRRRGTALGILPVWHLSLPKYLWPSPPNFAVYRSHYNVLWLMVTQAELLFVSQKLSLMDFQHGLVWLLDFYTDILFNLLNEPWIPSDLTHQYWNLPFIPYNGEKYTLVKFQSLVLPYRYQIVIYIWSPLVRI